MSDSSAGTPTPDLEATIRGLAPRCDCIWATTERPALIAEIERLQQQRQAALDLAAQALATGKRLDLVADERFWAWQVRAALGATE